MDSVSAVLILKSLDGLSLRATATAQNIANANSVGYKPVRVTFEDALMKAVPQGVAAIRNVSPQIITDGPSEYTGGMRLDLELATASSTAGRYTSLVEILNRQLQIDALAQSGMR
jgi:flagellar basal-body rod protein FlgB